MLFNFILKAILFKYLYAYFYNCMIIICSTSIFFVFIACILYKATHPYKPFISDTSCVDLPTESKGNRIMHGGSFLQKNPFGFYEVFVQGNAFERGVSMGKVCEEIKKKHERNFVDSFLQLVPSKTYQILLKFFIGILNRNLPNYFLPEYLDEIYGLSFSSSSEFNFIAPPYQRVLNYHAAHDIGHALQNIGLVACSSFVVKGSRTSDRKLLLARNLDFSPSEAFNELKVLYFIKPNQGHKYVSYSWPGFIGVVSGMNEHGLCVVLHAAKSKIRFSIGTPVSIIVKEILQYAKNIEEARVILNKTTSFVSELFLIASALDQSAVVFEKQVHCCTEYKMEGDELLCLNHFQSPALANDPENLEWKAFISSGYREIRLKELLAQHQKINPVVASEILRDIKGCNNENIGLQNENAINQLAAHHGIIFKPETNEFWVSSNPYMMGEMVAYNLNTAFEIAENGTKMDLYISEKIILKDAFLNSDEFEYFLRYKTKKKKLIEAIKVKQKLSKSWLAEFEILNPLLFTTHELLGDYQAKQNSLELAKGNYSRALELNIPTQFDKNRIFKKWKKV